MKDIKKKKSKCISFSSLGIDNSTLLDKVNDAVILMKEGKFIDCNIKAVEVFGYENKKQLINRKPYELSPIFQLNGVYSKDLAKKKIKTAIKGEPQFFEWKHIKSGGEIFDAEVSLNLLSVDTEKLLVAVVRDISRRKKSEEINSVLYNLSKASVESGSLEELLATIQKEVNRLMDARNFYVALIKNLQRGIYTIPYVVDENPEDIVSPEENLDLAGGFTDYVAKNGKPLLANKSVLESLRDEGARLIGTDSKSWLGVPLRISGGKIIGIVAVQSYSDPTAYSKKDQEVLLTISSTIASAIAHKRAEESIRYNEQRFKKLSEAAEEGLVFYGKGGVILDSNRAFLNMSGYKLSDINGKDVRSFLHISSVKGFFLKEKNRSNTPVEVKLLKKDGKVLFCLVNIKNFNPRKSEIKVASFKDITALKQYEMEKKELTERLIRSEKMEVIGRLAGGVAHDLNNVLMGIVNYPDMIIMNIDKKKFVLSAVKKIKESGLKAAAIVEDLLTLTRRGISRIEIFNINDVTNKFLNSPEFEKASRKFPDIKLKLDLDPDLRNIKGSVVHINSTLMNLVYNSMEAIKKKGIIEIVSRNIKSSGKLFGKKGDNYIMLSVSDNGVGMDENEREKIFEPFYTKKIMGRKGTGLGMSVIWGTVKDHNGFINIKSKKGKGTTFELFFPASDLPLADEEKVSDISGFKGRGEKILVVDDDEYAKDIACRYLKKSNYKAESVSSGEEAIKLIKKKKFDLIILDMLMSPGMDGLDTFKKIQEIKPGLKTLIASGFSETSRVREVLETGLSKFVKKPYSYAKLMSSVQEIING